MRESCARSRSKPNMLFNSFPFILVFSAGGPGRKLADPGAAPPDYFLDVSQLDFLRIRRPMVCSPNDGEYGARLYARAADCEQ